MGPAVQSRNNSPGCSCSQPGALGLALTHSSEHTDIVLQADEEGVIPPEHQLLDRLHKQMQICHVRVDRTRAVQSVSAAESGKC